MQLELRHLRALCAIADAGSLTKAATHLGVSQPSLTAQLHRIEAALGGQIFRRGRRGVVPTALGQFVLTRARAALLIVDELVEGAGSLDARAGVVRVGGYATPVLSGLVKRLFESPDVSVTVHTEHSPRLLLELLASRRLDAAVLVDYPGHELPVVPSIGMRLVAVEPVFLAMSRGHPLAALDEVPLADLAGDDWVLSPPDGVGWPECFIATCHEAGFTPRVPHIVTESAMIRQLISGGHAVSPCLAVFHAGTDIAVRPITGTPLWIRHLVAWRRDGPLAPRAEELVRLAADAHREAIADRPHYATWLARQGDISGTSTAPDR
ncbi:LysR family transcriptional regulator [Nonomuraea africana]|uniref:DNA-binding transcriptional LysR family regulator n=1 Tax=Nonomuraea africana TaxID=46171 RepID=A0ABR9KJ17_9ACTN|nr:LysR family transcriptional regulator [Nonomuraea africana]MBE1562004.1 DNA-binding transcriptional LysR family regulator [Nonomuraea africana]